MYIFISYVVIQNIWLLFLKTKKVGCVLFQ
jgi:hypothetical protein